ncbi:MAG: radical SAM protein [Desulfobacteraceae bacterium]|nr:radical SAM protein [Desulfobacteraceae bacterium]
MKFLLVRPHAHLPTSKWLQSMITLEPYAQELIASAILPPHEVEICDLILPENPIEFFKETLERFKPDFVGFGGFSSQFNANKELAGITKKVLPQAITCLGGIHSSSYPTGCKFPELFDLIVRGDGVSALKIIITSLEKENLLPESEWILQPGSDNFDELASKSPPAIKRDGIDAKPRRDLVDSSKYFCICYGEKGKKSKTLFPQIACVRTSVGCPNRCSFCVVHFLANGKYMQRTAEEVVDEIASLPQEYIYFVDDETFINTKRLRRIAELLIERNIKKKYLAWARVDTVCKDPELFVLWKKAGLEFLYVGFESLEEGALDDYNKNATPAQNREARKILADLDFNLHAALMVHPNFSKQDFLIVQKAIIEMAPSEFAFTVYSPPPGTQEFLESKDKFICDDPCLYYDCIHTILPTKLPLKTFYKYFSILYLKGSAYIPARTNKIRVPLKDFFRVLIGAIKFGWIVKRMYRRYDRKYW